MRKHIIQHTDKEVQNEDHYQLEHKLVHLRLAIRQNLSILFRTYIADILICSKLSLHKIIYYRFVIAKDAYQ